MQSIFDQGPPPPCPNPFNMAAHVLGQADFDPDKIALSVLGDRDWSYGALKTAVLGTATGLLQTGAQPGDRILMRLGDTVDFPLVYHQGYTNTVDFTMIWDQGHTNTVDFTMI